MKRILVTGGSGFIGSHLTRRLVNEGYKVAITTKYNSLFENIRLVDIWNKIQVIETDLRNFDTIDKINKFRPNVIFHLAAYNDVGGSFDNVTESLSSGLFATSNLLDGLKNFDQFIYISTSEVYGFQKKVPFVETMEPQPLSPYSIGKYSGELYANMFMKFYNKPIKIIRPFNAFGPWQSMKAIIPEIVIKCLRGEDILTTAGTQTREFNYVENLVDGFITCMCSKKTMKKVVNIGSNNETRIKDIVKIIHKITQSESRLQIGALNFRKTDIKRMKSNYSKFHQLTNWKPKINLINGLKNTIFWYKKYLEEFENTEGNFRKLF